MSAARRRRGRGALLGLVLVAPLLAGCTPTVALRPAPEATAIGCAAVIVRLPASVVGNDRRDTDAQGTAAWGEPVAVSLRCGVTPPGPTESSCFSSEGVDWIRQEVPVAGRTDTVLTTYGRVPATQVVIRPGLESAIGDLLSDISYSVRLATTATAACTTAPSASATPSPSPSPSASTGR